MEIKARNKKIDEDEFIRMRAEVLAEWPTGKEVDLEEAIEYQKKLPENKNFSKVVERLHNEGKTAIFPRAGTPALEKEIELVQALVGAGVPLIPVNTDNYTNQGRYDKAQPVLEESIRTGRPLLTGFPLVNHGIQNTRRVVESCDGAFSARVGPLAKLGAEIALASGMTGILVTPMNTFSHYSKKMALEDIIESSQYEFRLMGYYADRGILLTTDFHVLTGGGVFPQSVAHASQIVEGVMAAEQGVKSVIPYTMTLGNMMEDIANARVARRLVREYLDKLGYKDVMVPGAVQAQPPLFPHPQGMGEAFGYLCYSAVVIVLSGTEVADIRTIDEGAGTPPKETHVLSYKAAQWIFDVIREQKIELEEKEIDMEEEIIEMEVRAITDKLLELGDGDIVVGAIKGVELGVLDTSFPTNMNIHGNVLGVRDNKGMCRYLEFGNLPIPDEAKEYHRQKLAEREEAEGRKLDYKVAVEDMWTISRGHLISRP